MTANNMSDVRVSPDVLSTLFLLQQGNVYKLRKILHGISRGSCPEVSEKKLPLKLRAEFTGKHLCRGLFNKVAGLKFQPATLLKRDSNTGVFL